MRRDPTRGLLLLRLLLRLRLRLLLLRLHAHTRCDVIGVFFGAGVDGAEPWGRGAWVPAGGREQ
jgi:hypothetical protein